MSRALDAETAASLKKGDPLAAYQSISNVLAPPTDGLLEIEILGKSHFIVHDGQHVLQDGRAVGISKLALVQAFLVGRQRLQDHLRGLMPQPDDELFAVTAVILLFDPEYLTAANARKRLLRAQITSSSSSSIEARVRLLEGEKRFVDSLLTSRLHRHTKSPTLWSHRRWLVATTASLGLPVDVRRDIGDIVCVAGERHPRNYYGWCHARFLMGLVNESVHRREIRGMVQAWCFQHHTDISGWSFLYFLLDAESGSRTDAGCPTFTEVLNLVRSLRLTNESVWVFLRTLAASRLVRDEQYSQFLAVQAAVLEPLKNPAEQAVLRAAVDWCTTYRERGTNTAGV